MIFRSNLTAPDLQPYFKHVTSRVMPHSFGHDVLSDWADKSDDDPIFGVYKQCGFLTHDEAAILYNVAKQLGPALWWDIGCHTGWTSAHIAAAYPIPFNAGALTLPPPHNYVIGIDPMVQEFGERIRENHIQGPGRTYGFETPYMSDAWINKYGMDWPPAGVMIDADHDAPAPLNDAQNALKHLAPTGVIVLHDFIGKPVRDAVEYLMSEGMKCRLYWTPYILAVCWRGDFTPPEHHGDPELARILPERVQPFDLGRCV